MEIDELIARLGAKLDEWFDENRSAFVSENKKEQANALLSGFTLVKELDHLKGDGLAAIGLLLNPAHTNTPAEYAESLVRGFEFATKLADTLHDELLDTDGETKVVHLMNDIASTLDGIGAGRVALAILLDDPNPGVRAAAGAYLIKLMPSRVVPILREIEDTERGSSAGFNAHSAIIAWERESKADTK
ncbi:MAG: hypothetical protein WA652_04945 [Xanthobacteraceae bacterium]